MTFVQEMLIWIFLSDRIFWISFSHNGRYMENCSSLKLRGELASYLACMELPKDKVYQVCSGKLDPDLDPEYGYHAMFLFKTSSQKLTGGLVLNLAWSFLG